MTETFKIKFVDYKHYKILQQPEIEFPQCKMCDILIESIAFPETNPTSIYLRGRSKMYDEFVVKLYPKHLKALDEFCKYKHWRFVICI